MKKLTLLFLILFSSPTYALPMLPLENIGTYISDELEINSIAMESSINNTSEEDQWLITFMKITLKASVGFELKWVAGAKVSAGVEFFWTR